MFPSAFKAMNPVLMATGLSFLMPMVAALHVDAMFFAFASANLTMSSVLYHWSKDPYYFWVDQVMVFLYVAAAVYEAFFKGRMFHQVLVGVMCIYATCVYHYGYLYTCYVWDSDCFTATRHHAGMHFVSALAGTVMLLT